MDDDRFGYLPNGDEQEPDRLEEFGIQSGVDLDFVISQESGLPVGMTRSSPAEFRRRVLAAAVSYRLQLRSIDYTLKRYVQPRLWDESEEGLGDQASDFLKESMEVLKDRLRDLHTQDENLALGIFGAEISLFKFPETLDLARMLANRGLLLEALPVLRLCVEMAAWSAVAFRLDTDYGVKDLKAQSCISKIKPIYGSAGHIYGYLSKFAHWDQAIHPYFLKVEEGKTMVIAASRKYRAMSLSLCLLILDLLLEVVRDLYGEASERLLIEIQGTFERSDARLVHQLMAAIADQTNLTEIKNFQRMLC